MKRGGDGTHLGPEKDEVVPDLLALDDAVDQVLLLAPQVLRPRPLEVPFELLGGGCRYGLFWLFDRVLRELERGVVSGRKGLLDLKGTSRL